MHLAKGLEFRAVAVMACDDEVIPQQKRIETVADDSDLEEVYNTERQLLYVACTRAGDGVRDGCDHRDEQEEKRSEGGTGGGRRRAPTVLSRIRQGGPERPRQPTENGDSPAIKYGRHTN